MKVKINDAYKAILTTDLASVSTDDVSVAWIVNRALSAAGRPPMFDIDADADGDALVVLTSAPDDYRGDMDAIHILFPDVDLKLVDDHDLGDIHAVYRKGDGRLLGHLTSYYGNNGRGGLAAQDFDPAPGVTVKFD